MSGNIGQRSNGDGGLVGGTGGVAGDSVGIDTALTPPVDTVVRRGRGRPRNSDSAGSPGGTTSAGTGKTKEKSAPLDLSGIENALVGIHAGIALMTKQDHWAIDETEAHALGKGISNVARHYPNVASSQKIVDWVMLIQALGFTYGPRIMMSATLTKEIKS